MLDIIQDFLTPNEWSRPQKKLKELKAIVMHWTENPGLGAKANRDFFESRKNGQNGYGSAHYIVGQSGVIVQCIPEMEIAYHCGTSQKDPASGLVYTDDARCRFPEYCSELTSPNFCTVGIELCPDFATKDFTVKTIESAATLCADILTRYSLDERAITTHYAVVGHKDCPRPWVGNPRLFDDFVRCVQVCMPTKKDWYNERR